MCVQFRICMCVSAWTLTHTSTQSPNGVSVCFHSCAVNRNKMNTTRNSSKRFRSSRHSIVNCALVTCHYVNAYNLATIAYVQSAERIQRHFRCVCVPCMQVWVLSVRVLCARVCMYTLCVRVCVCLCLCSCLCLCVRVDVGQQSSIVLVSV